MKLTKQDEILIRDLEEFANDSDVNESGIYTKILDFIRRLQSGYSSASTASDEWKAKYEAEREENIKQKAEIKRLMKELSKATDSLVTASRCFTRMETFYKGKCQEFETAKEKDAADSKQHCKKCRTYWLSKLDTQKERTAQLQKQVEELKEQKGFWEGMHDRVCSKLEEYDDKSEEYENALVMKQCRITELQKQVSELKEKIMNLKSAMIDRVARKSYDSLLTTIEDVEEIFGDAYESEFNKLLEEAVKDKAKETAKEILQEGKYCLSKSLKDWIKERYGVEVK